ncbi:hypothetical protein [Legionella sp. PC997]|uniref:hypothetical protein n=1 Tax=Legionella sp. PC997 TaxID=2755562 RepID=UPI0015F84EC3|nr:hypothetical protein [Legionella sp. PC997]
MMNEKKNTLMMLVKSVIKGSFFRLDTMFCPGGASALKEMHSIRALTKKNMQ